MDRRKSSRRIEVALMKVNSLKIKSPIVTLLVGLLIAVIVAILSVNAKESAPEHYGASALVGVAR
jgi:hypothetical protein